MKRRALAVALGRAGAAQAQVPGPAPGNELHPAPVNPATFARPRDPEGLGQREPAARSPTGRLYDPPLDPGEPVDPKQAGWSVAGVVEAGGITLHGDKRSQGFLAAKDVKGGAVINAFALTAERPDMAAFVELTGGGIGMDAFYRLQGGRANAWKIATFYDETAHTWTAGYRSPWTGVGTGTLVLDGLPAGGAASAAATQAAVGAALAAVPETTLETVRRKAGVRADARLTETWKVYASFTQERREGARPLGAIFGGTNVVVAEPIDSGTRDLVAGVQFSDVASSFNLRVAASFFHNGIDTLTYQNPLFATPGGTTGLAAARFTQGRFDLAPDNQHYTVKGEYARTLPFWRGSVTATAAVGRMQQDDALVAPTTLDLAGGSITAGGVPLAGNWNSVAALARGDARTRIDTRLADLGLALRPLATLDVRARLRYEETRNDGRYIACNPLTGQLGRLLYDGAGVSLVTASTAARVNPAGTSANAFNAAGCDLDAARALSLVPASGNVPIASVPYDQRQAAASLTADWRAGRASTLSGTLERQHVHRDFRERAATWEDRLKLGYVDRGLLEGTLRLGYEHTRRAGDAYDPNPVVAFRSASLGPAPGDGNVSVASWLQAVEGFRSFDLADRRQDLATARVDAAILEGLDAAATLRLKDARYPSDFGRTRQRSGTATLDLTWHAGPAASVYGFYAYEAATLAQRGLQPESCIVGNTYYFYGDGRVASAATGAAAPTVPTGTTLIATRAVTGANWREACGSVSATSPLFNTSHAWDVASRNRHHTLGLGAHVDLKRARLDASCTRALGRTRIGYAYDPVALGLAAQQAALAGSRLPDMSFAQTILEASVTAPLRPNVAIRVLARRETGRVRDWHDDGLATTPLPTAGSMYLDSGPRDYRATLFGLFLVVRL